MNFCYLEWEFFDINNENHKETSFSYNCSHGPFKNMSVTAQTDVFRIFKVKIISIDSFICMGIKNEHVLAVWTNIFTNA